MLFSMSCRHRWALYGSPPPPVTTAPAVTSGGPSSALPATWPRPSPGGNSITVTWAARIHPLLYGFAAYRLISLRQILPILPTRSSCPVLTWWSNEETARLGSHARCSTHIERFPWLSCDINGYSFTFQAVHYLKKQKQTALYKPSWCNSRSSRFSTV